MFAVSIYKCSSNTNRHSYKLILSHWVIIAFIFYSNLYRIILLRLILFMRLCEHKVSDNSVTLVTHIHTHKLNHREEKRRNVTKSTTLFEFACAFCEVDEKSIRVFLPPSTRLSHITILLFRDGDFCVSLVLVECCIHHFVDGPNKRTICVLKSAAYWHRNLPPIIFRQKSTYHARIVFSFPILHRILCI